MKNLNEVLDEIFGPMSCEEKDRIVEAVNKDNSNHSVSDITAILHTLNEVFGKKHRVIPQKIMGRYKAILKVYSISEIREAFEKARDDDYHKETGYKYCTPEYFSRMEQMDKWVSYEPKQKQSGGGFQMPKMNL